ncbi:hypothetical protein L1887_48455 [Cichorium endivia]|nr:hypothetical protein L1887_48455 [Cichorium endivia]
MRRSVSSRATTASSSTSSSDTYGDHRQQSRATGQSSYDAGLGGKSYYDRYPERKRTGPYVPRATLVAHHESHASKPSVAKADPSRRSVSSTYAASSIALGRARPHAAVQEPVKSIDEIVQAHSSSLLSVPPLQRAPQRSASWSAFELDARTSPEAARRARRSEADSDSDSTRSEDSIEQEARTILRRTQVDEIESGLSQLRIRGKHTSAGPSTERQASLAGDSTKYRQPRRPLTRDSKSDAAGPNCKGLSHVAMINMAGSRQLQVSFADVGLPSGHPVMVFLGLGASRHLIGLYDDLATLFGLRLVCIDRWGIGRTDHVAPESRSILGWSFVVEQVADLLGLGKYAVVAHSAGGPFAAALALLFPERVQGPVHLLAPWTGMQQDSGYRWLRYIPDGVIKTAQAAEWRIQNWKLGKEGTRIASKTLPAQGGDDAAPRSPRLGVGEARPGSHASSSADTPTWAEASASALYASDGRGGNWEEAERNSAVELLRASHAESSRGLVDDLNLVLGKRPWGFDYTDLGVACEVWHGSKDEKIALSSSVSLAREMRDCQLHVVEGASHSLMTNSSVVMQVFESIVKHWQAVSPSGAR